MTKYLLPVIVVITLCVLAATPPTERIPGQEYAASVSLSGMQAKPIAPFVQNGITWLVAAQLPNGGWGAGLHSRQDVRDPHQVQMDPATTAFAAMALLRTGNTLNSGPYAQQLRKALDAMLEVIAHAPDGNNITAITGTQPQRKLGQNIDVAMASQFLTKIRTTVQDPGLSKRIDNALAVCIEKLEQAQNDDGSYAQGGWAPVLQSAMATSALEEVVVSGYRVDRKKLDKARSYQRSNVDATSGSISAGDAAGVSLYALASTQRASAKEAARVREIFADTPGMNMEEVPAGILKHKLEEQGLDSDEAGVLADAYVVNRAATERLQDDKVLSGFGNNGGEEFLSYMMTSESLATDPASWDTWHAKMGNMLSSVQNPDGSWSGHHCITSPVFCTAAVILAMTADRDVALAQTEIK